MARRFKVEGTDDGTICISVDGKQTILSVDRDIQAEDIYNDMIRLFFLGHGHFLPYSEIDSL